MLPSSTACLGYQLFANSLNELPICHKVINTINQYSYCMAEQDSEFKLALQNSDVLLPDGIGIVMAAKFLKGKILKRITGADLHEHMLTVLNASGGKCFYFGSSNNTLDKIKQRLKNEFPAVQCQFFSPPYKDVFSDVENEEMIKSINEFKPNVLFVGMTAPKQEKWTNINKDKINAEIICSIGAVFDFYAGTIQRPAKIWMEFGLEWLGRLVKEPRRLYKRYLYYGPIFAYKLIEEKVRGDLLFHNEFKNIN